MTEGSPVTLISYFLESASGNGNLFEFLLVQVVDNQLVMNWHLSGSTKGNIAFMKTINTLLSLKSIFTLIVLCGSLASFASDKESSVSQVLSARPLRKVVELQWPANRGMNTSRFIVQRSTDGKVYQEIAVIEVRENSNATRTYTYTDDRVVRGKAPVFYRLKVVSRDGQFVYSGVKTVTKERSAEIVY